MAERLLAQLINDVEKSLSQYKKGKASVAELEHTIVTLKAKLASIVARYCDDFSSVEFYQHLKQMEGKDATDEER